MDDAAFRLLVTWGLIALIASCGGTAAGIAPPPVEACLDAQQRNEAGQCVDVFVCPPDQFGSIADTVGPGDEFITWVVTDEVGHVAVKVRVPAQPRYVTRAGVVVNVATFFTSTAPFYSDLDATQVGLIHVSYLWPGAKDVASGACSEGVFDHGGPTSIAALRDVVRYALGDLKDHEGLTLNDRLASATITADADNVGLWAFSHPGIAAINVLARNQERLSGVAWFVGRENPTQDQHSAVELGHFADDGERVINPLYDYEAHYSPGDISLDVSSASWNPDFQEGDHEKGRAYFDLDGDGFDQTEDHVLSFRVPTMYGKRTLSRRLTTALRDNGLTEDMWPADLSTPEEAEALWSYRNAVDRYPDLAGSGLRALLVFGRRQHVQPLPDAASIHSAWDGLQAAGLWVRLNPDQAYATWATETQLLTTPDADANTAPGDWATAGDDFGHSALDGGSGYSGGSNVGWAAVAEMADRTEFQRWEPNLSEVLVPNYPTPPPPPLN